MFGALTAASDWLQRKALHYLLHTRLREVFEDDCELEQLQVQLRSHAEHGDLAWRCVLRDVRLNARALSAHLVCWGPRVEAEGWGVEGPA